VECRVRELPTRNTRRAKNVVLDGAMGELASGGCCEGRRAFRRRGSMAISRSAPPENHDRLPLRASPVLLHLLCAVASTTSHINDARFKVHLSRYLYGDSIDFERDATVADVA